MKNSDVHTYEDIIDMPHHVSSKHPQMKNLDRAAQFAPFAALSGHKEAVVEAERLTNEKKLLAESQKEILNDKLQEIILQIKEKPYIKVTYFKVDDKKDGGDYHTIIKKIKKVDEVYHVLLFVDKTVINIMDIYDVELLIDTKELGNENDL